MKHLILASLILFSFPALALTPDQIVQQQQMILQQQDQQRASEQQQIDINEATRLRSVREKSGALGDTAATTGMPGAGTADCAPIRTIQITGNDVYSDRTLRRAVTDKYIGKCINRDNMNAVQNDLTAYYIDRGYTIARIYFDLKKSQFTHDDGLMFLVIEEGKISKIKATEKIGDAESALTPAQQKRRDRAVYFAVPSTAGDIFNIRDFEQGLDQINRLQSNNATMDIRPSDDAAYAGYSDIYIMNNRDPSTTFWSIGADNNGNKNTGENTANVSLNQDNLFNISDNIFLKYTKDIGLDYNHHHSQSVYANMSVPFGYWTANAAVSWSEYLTTVDGMYTSFHTSGDTITGTFSLDRVLWRNKSFKTNLGAALEYKDISSYIRDAKSKIGSRATSNINIYWANTIFTNFGTIMLKPSYQRGLGILGAKQDADNLMDIEPRLQYDMIKFYAYFNTRMNIFVPINYTLSIDSQYAFSALYGTDQFSVGGPYTVRGFRDSVISGDNGFYIRNDAKVGINNLLPNVMTDKKFMNAGGNWSANSLLSKTTIGAFYDVGYVQNKYKITPDPYDSNDGIMTGVGLSLGYSGKYMNWSLSYARALSAPEYLQTRDGIATEEQSIYWRISANY